MGRTLLLGLSAAHYKKLNELNTHRQNDEKDNKKPTLMERKKKPVAIVDNEMILLNEAKLLLSEVFKVK